MALVLYGGVRFSGWILNKKGDTEEEAVEDMEDTPEKKRRIARLIDIGTIKDMPQSTK